MSFDLAVWEERLRSTLDDGRASRGERSALRELARDEDLNSADRARLRALVFDLARDLDAPDAALDWVEDVLRTLEAPPSAEVAANVVAFSPGDEPRQELIERIDATRSRLDVAVFTITDDRITRALIRAAERGVHVRVLGDDAKAHDLGSDMFQLARHAKVEVALDHEGHMHHKFAIFDGRSLATGSFNWTRSASHANHENVLITEDPESVRIFGREFERLWHLYGE